jgi:hypothetical protein
MDIFCQLAHRARLFPTPLLVAVNPVGGASKLAIIFCVGSISEPLGGIACKKVAGSSSRTLSSVVLQPMAHRKIVATQIAAHTKLTVSIFILDGFCISCRVSTIPPVSIP